MGLPSVNIAVIGGLQQSSTVSTVTAMVLQGVALATLSLETPYRLTSLDDARALGLSANYDSNNSSAAWKHIADFYSVARKGTLLWVIVISHNVTMTQMAAHSSVRKLLDAAQGEVGILVITRNHLSVSHVPTLQNAMDSDVMTAIEAFHTLASNETAMYKPLRVLIEARHIDYAQVNSLPNLNTYSYNRVAVVAGDNVASSRGSAVGLAAGRFASIPVQRNIARVRDGAIAQQVFFFNDTPISKPPLSAILHDKGFITFRYHVSRGGYYFTDDPTATISTDDYSSVARGRVIDKVIRLLYAVYLNYLADEVTINPQTGQIEAAQIKSWQAAAQSALDSQMTANNEISGATVTVDPAQNVVATNKVKITVAVLPVGYAKTIDIEIGFVNSLNANNN